VVKRQRRTEAGEAPRGQGRRPRIPGVFEGGATQPAGMHRRPTAAGVSPRAARLEL